MIKLADLLELQMQPSEPSRMKNYLYRGTKEQIAQAKEAKDEFIMEPYDDEGSTTYSKMKGTIEEDPITTDHPENKRRVVGWEWDEMNTLESVDMVKNALLGRELQTLEDVKKIIDRLKARGFNKQEIVKYVMQYIDTLDETVGYVMKVKPSVSGGMTQDEETL